MRNNVITIFVGTPTGLYTNTTFSAPYVPTGTIRAGLKALGHGVFVHPDSPFFTPLLDLIEEARNDT